MINFSDSVNTQSVKVGNRKPVTVSNRSTGYTIPSDMPSDDGEGIPCRNQYRLNQIMSKYQPPANVRWYDDDEMDEAAKDEAVANILAKYR